MKHKRSLLAVILVVVLLTFAVSGTIAYLTVSKGPITNTFQPTKVDTQIVEEFDEDGTAKTSITVTNPRSPEAIPAFVRVAIYGNWCDVEGNVVEAWTIPADLKLGANWKKNGEFFYYTKEVPVGGTTENLLGNGATISSIHPTNSNLHLVVTVMQQAIQSEPLTAVTEMWGVNPTTLN